MKTYFLSQLSSGTEFKLNPETKVSFKLLEATTTFKCYDAFGCEIYFKDQIVYVDEDKPRFKLRVWRDVKRSITEYHIERSYHFEDVTRKNKEIIYDGFPLEYLFNIIKEAHK